MMNVDGVISGNYRSNLSGSDINRQWQFPSKRGQPEVYWLKQEISSNKKQTAFFLDIHAHSRKMGSFFYGSKAASRDNKLYPFICSKLNKFVSYA
jgi:murein tripeptide amidase MpaA